MFIIERQEAAIGEYKHRGSLHSVYCRTRNSMNASHREKFLDFYATLLQSRRGITEDDGKFTYMSLIRSHRFK